MLAEAPIPPRPKVGFALKWTLPRRLDQLNPLVPTLHPRPRSRLNPDLEVDPKLPDLLLLPKLPDLLLLPKLPDRLLPKEPERPKLLELLLGLRR